MISISRYYGNSVVLAVRVKPRNKQCPGLLSAWRTCVLNTTLDGLQMAKLQAYVSVAMVTVFQYLPVNHLMKLPRKLCLPCMKFILLQMPEFWKYFSVAMTTRFPWQQVLPDIVVAPGDIPSKYKICMPSTANLWRYVSVAMDTRFPKLQVTSFISVASVDNSTKFEVYTPSESNATIVCFCCHGYKISQ